MSDLEEARKRVITDLIDRVSNLEEIAATVALFDEDRFRRLEIKVKDLEDRLKSPLLK